MRALGFQRFHVVGHSFGAVIALQMAHDAREAVATLALLEMPDMGVPSAPGSTEGIVVPAFGQYGAGDPVGAIDAFLGGVCGREQWLETRRSLPQGLQDAVRAADADDPRRSARPGSTQRWLSGVVS